MLKSIRVFLACFLIFGATVAIASSPSIPDPVTPRDFQDNLRHQIRALDLLLRDIEVFDRAWVLAVRRQTEIALFSIREKGIMHAESVQALQALALAHRHRANRWADVTSRRNQFAGQTLIELSAGIAHTTGFDQETLGRVTLALYQEIASLIRLFPKASLDVAPTGAAQELTLLLPEVGRLIGVSKLGDNSRTLDAGKIVNARIAQVLAQDFTSQTSPQLNEMMMTILGLNETWAAAMRFTSEKRP